MKKLLFTMLCGLSLLSCDSLSQPKAAEQIIPWVYANSYSPESVIEWFIDKRFQDVDKLDLIGNYDDDESGDASYTEFQAHFAMARLMAEAWDSPFRQNLSEFLSFKRWTYELINEEGIREQLESSWRYNFVNYLVNKGWDRKVAQYYNDLLLSDVKKVTDNVQNILSNIVYKLEISEKAKNNTEIIDCILDVDSQGSSYTGYLVTYSIDGGKLYTLASLTEFDNSDRIEYAILAIEKSVLKINEHIKRE